MSEIQVMCLGVVIGMLVAFPLGFCCGYDVYSKWKQIDLENKKK